MCPSSHVKSNTYFKAMNQDCWRKAIQCEISASESDQTQEATLLPKSKTAIGFKWASKIKYKVDETVERYKSILVTKGSIHTNRGH